MSDGADRLLGLLADAGVEAMFGNPGSTELPLVDALARQSRVRYVLGLHEAAVMGMADGYAQQGDRLAVVNLHVQPGLANGLSGILNARRARVPMLVTVGQQVRSMLPGAPFLGGELLDMARPLAKAAFEVAEPGQLPALVERAIGIALRHPRGPVVLSLPMDVLSARAAGGTPVVLSAVPGVDADELARAEHLLERAERPVILVGDGVAHEHCGDAVAALAERLGAPMWGEPFAARMPVPSRHPLWMGPLPAFAADIAPLLAGHDAVLALAMPVFRLFGHSDADLSRLGGRLIHVDADPEEIGRTHHPAVGLRASVAAVVSALGAETGVAPAVLLERRRAAREAAADRRERDLAALAADVAADAVRPGALALAVARAVAGDDLVVDEALTSGRGLRAALGARNGPGNWLAHRGSALGWGLPAAVGAKLADPGRRVLCVHGDGSALFGVHALWTAAHERLGVAVVIADNGGYEILRAGLEGLTGRVEGAWPGLAITDPSLDLVSVCRGFGADAERVDDPADLDGALAHLWDRAESGPAVLVVGVRGRTPPVGYPLPA